VRIEANDRRGLERLLGIGDPTVHTEVSTFPGDPVKARGGPTRHNETRSEWCGWEAGGLWLESAGNGSPQVEGAQEGLPPLQGGVYPSLVGVPPLCLVEWEVGPGLGGGVVQRKRFHLEVRLPEGRPARG
jgi:hypothetical protein